MKIRVLWLFTLLALVAGHGQAQAQQEGKAYSITAISLSRAIFAGVRVGAEAAFRDGKITSEQLACYAALDDSSLAPLYDSLLREVLSDEDIRTLDGFYGSEAGRRYYRWSLNQLRSQQKLPIKEPLELSPEEMKRAEDFHASGPGLVLAGIGASGTASERKIGEALAKALKPCQ